MKTNSSSLAPRHTVALATLAALAGPLVAPSALAQNTATWTGSGSDDNWSTPGNWSGNNPPVNDGSYAVYLSSAAGGISHVDTPYDVANIGFTANAGTYTLTGERIDLRGTGAGADSNFLVSSSAYAAGLTQTVENNLRMMAAGAFRANTGNLVLKGELDLNNVTNVRFIAEAGRTLTLDGAIKGATGGTVAFNGHGVVEVNGDNTYTGTTKIWGNVTVKLGSSSALGASTSTVILGTESGSSAGTPALLTNAAITVSRHIRVFTSSDAGRLVTIGGASAHVSEFTGNVYLKSYDVSAIDAMPLTVTAAEGGRVNIRGNIVREANATGSRDTLRKTGDGIVALYGTNTYSGATTVEEGTLLVHGTISNANFAHTPGVFTVKSGAALGGAGGGINRDVFVESGGIFTPGDLDADGATSLAGSLTVNGGLAFENGALLRFDFGDSVSVSGDLTLAGFLTITDSESWSVGLHTLFSYAGELDASGLTLDPNLGERYSLDFGVDGLVRLGVAAIPEPATAASLLGLAGLLTAACGRRRR